MGAAPPLVGRPVKVTCWPAQIEAVDWLIVTVGTTLGFTVIVAPVPSAVVGEAHIALEVNITDTTSLLPRLLLIKVLVPVPVFTPFTLH